MTFNAADIALNTAAGPAATISGIEKVNINIDAFDGTATTFDAANTKGATITLSSVKLGFNGTAGVENVKTNSVVAGTGIKNLTVEDLTTGVVDTGAATAADVDTNAATDTANVKVNGDIDLTITTATKTVITATAAATIELTEAAGQLTQTTIAGANDVTLSVDAANISTNTIVNSLTAGSLTVELTTAADSDVTKVDADLIVLDGDFGNDKTITVANGAKLKIAEAQTTNALKIVGDAANATNTVSLSAGFNINELEVQDDGLTTTIDATAAITIATLLATGEDVLLTGSSDVEVTTSDAASFDANKFSGNLTYTSSVTAGVDIVGGSGKNNVTLAGGDATFTGQGGDDTLDALLINDDILVAIMGAGNDKVSIDTPAETLVIDFGDGSADTLYLADDADLSGATATISGLEIVEIDNADASLEVTFAAKQLNGQTYTIKTADTTDAANVVVAGTVAAGETIDLSKLVLSKIDTFEITGNAGKDTITGTSAADVIDGAGGGDVLTGGGGADTFVFNANDSTATKFAEITDFNITVDTLDLDTGTEVVADEASVDVKSVVTGATQITATIADGVLTVAGTNGSAIDTLAEWVAVAKLAIAAAEEGADEDATLAFEFDGATYVLEASSTDAGDVVDVLNLIKLTGVTDIVALDTTAGAGAIVLV